MSPGPEERGIRCVEWNILFSQRCYVTVQSAAEKSISPLNRFPCGIGTFDRVQLAPRHGMVSRMSAAHRRPDATHPALARITGVVALLALLRALALTTGVFDPGHTITARLPFQSTALGGLTLALIVVVPMATTALWASAGHPRAGELAMLAGVLLVCWIGVQLIVIRTFTWVQPVMVVVGLAVFATGWWLHGRDHRFTGSPR